MADVPDSYPFYFAVELFAFPMCMVQPYNIMVVQPQVGPPGIGPNVMGEQELTVLVNRVVYNLMSHADGNSLLLT